MDVAEGRVGVLAASRAGLVAGQWRYLSYSGDGGTTWTVADSVSSETFHHVEFRNDTVFAGYSLFPNTPPYGVRFSVDDGATWKELPDEASSGFTWADVQGDSGINDTDSEVSYRLSMNRVFVRHSGDSAWIPATTALQPMGGSINSLDAEGNRLAVMVDKDYYVADRQALRWEFIDGYTGFQGERIILTDDALYRPWGSYSVRVGRVEMYSFDSKRWTTLVFPTSFYKNALSSSGRRIAFVGTDYRVAFTEDDGRSFITGGARPSEASERFASVSGSNAIVITNGAATWVSRNDGTTWSRLADFAAPLPTSPDSLALTDSGLYAAVRGHGIQFNPMREAGDGWRPVPAPIDSSGSSVPTRLAANGPTLYLSHGGSLWMQVDSVTVPVLARRKSPKTVPSISADAPVRVWSRPGDGSSPGSRFDALGSIRAGK